MTHFITIDGTPTPFSEAIKDPGVRALVAEQFRKQRDPLQQNPLQRALDAVERAEKAGAANCAAAAAAAPSTFPFAEIRKHALDVVEGRAEVSRTADEFDTALMVHVAKMSKPGESEGATLNRLIDEQDETVTLLSIGKRAAIDQVDATAVEVQRDPSAFTKVLSSRESVWSEMQKLATRLAPKEDPDVAIGRLLGTDDTMQALYKKYLGG
jgi:hypothetical protein